MNILEYKEDRQLKRFVHPVESAPAPNRVLFFQDKILEEKNSDTRKRRLIKALNFIKEDKDIINQYTFTDSGTDFKINFTDGRSLRWNSDGLPVDWLEVLWRYGTTSVPTVSSRLNDEPGGLFDSNASTQVK